MAEIEDAEAAVDSEVLQELEFEHQLAVRAHAALSQPDDPILVLGERICFLSHNVSLKDVRGVVVGSLYLTNHRLIFNPQRNGRKSGSGTPSPRNSIISLSNAFSPRLNWARCNIPLGLVSQISKNYDTMTGIQYSLELTLKDGRILRLAGFAHETVHLKLMQFAFPESFSRSVFAFSFRLAKPVSAQNDGWNLYDAKREYMRIGVPNYSWRFTHLNENYSFCSTYPSLLVVPTTASDDLMVQVAKYRSRGRVPTLSWLHPQSNGILCRCAQPSAGPFGRRSVADEGLLRLIRGCANNGSVQNNTNSGASLSNNEADKTLLILDARPRVNAETNRAFGGGYENIVYYASTELEFLNIDKIHTMRDSYRRLNLLCQAAIPNEDTFLTDLDATEWLKHLRLVLVAAVRAITLVHQGRPVLVHCSDGWDRSSQITSLAMLCLDPFYRTKKGFAILIEKEWLSFGHKFHERIGHGKNNHADIERAPIFLQFLDAVWQILNQFPIAFEFNEQFLIAVADESISCKYGTFIMDSEWQRKQFNLSTLTVSLWTVLFQSADDDYNDPYTNPLFSSNQAVLFPSTSSRQLELWRSYHLRHSPLPRPAQTAAEEIRQQAAKIMIELRRLKTAASN